MKKVASIILSFLLIFPTSALAAFQMIPGDAQYDEFIISSSSVSGKKAVLFVIDSEKSIEEFKRSDAGEHIISESVIYADVDNITDGGYEFKFTMTGQGSDTYKAIVTIDNGIYDVQEFSFYPKTEKLLFMSYLANGNITDEIIDSAISVFSLKSYAPSDNTEAARILTNIRSEENVFLGTDINKCKEYIMRSFVISDLNKGSSYLYDGEIFRYSEEMQINSLLEWKDYVENLNADGISAVKSGLKNITNYSDFKNKFSELVKVNVLTNYKDLGSGHVDTYLTQYKSSYSLAGFNIDALSECSDKAMVYGAVSSSNKTTLAELANIFNEALKLPSTQSGVQNNNPVKTPGSSGGGGSLGYIQPETIPGTSTDYSYTDVSDKHWAYSYINTLAKAGIINGKGDGCFAPDDNVKRGEFAKMIVLAAGLAPNENACNFSDTLDSWSKGYIGAAVSYGIVSGVDENNFKPESEVTREQAATIIGRALKLGSVNTTQVFADDNQISVWARDFVYSLKEAGILNGRGNNMFEPQATLTRAEAAKLISIVFEKLK